MLSILCEKEFSFLRNLFFITLAISSNTSCNYSNQTDAETIRIGLTMPQGMEAVAYVNGMYEMFKDEVEANSNGKLKVQIYYGGVLGKPDQRLNMMRRNVIQMSDGSDGNYATIHRDIQVFSMP